MALSLQDRDLRYPARPQSISAEPWRERRVSVEEAASHLDMLSED
ncbi:hypothetical protein [Actinomadura logoneensis]|nr:hypothetical protein [Actinomadura logoneensis]